MLERFKKYRLFLAFLLVLGAMFLIPAGRAEAADIQVIIDVSPSEEVEVGDTVRVNISVRGEAVWDTTLTVSYPSNLLEYSGGNGGTASVHIDGESTATLTFKAVGKGSALVATTGTSAYDSEGNTLEIEHASERVTIGGEENTTEKQTETEKKTEENTEAKSEEGSGNSTEETTEKKSQVDAKDARAEMNGITYVFVQPKNPADIPKGYVLTSVRYLNWMVPAYISENKLITIVALVDASTLPPAEETGEEGQNTEQDTEQDTQEDAQDTGETTDDAETAEELIAWYRLDEKNSILSPYVEYSAEDVKLIPLEKPSNVTVPEGFDKMSVDLGHGAITTYQSVLLDKIVLIYGVTPTGTEGFYYYDTVEKTFIRYIPMKQAEPDPDMTREQTDTGLSENTEPKEDEGFFTKDNLGNLLIGAVGLFLLMAIFAMVLMIQNAKLGNKLEAAEEKLQAYRKGRRNGETVKSSVRNRDIVDNADDGDDNDEDEEDEASGTEASAGRTVSGDTIEIILEDAKDNNSSVKRPPVKETRRNSVEDAMKERPHGIDSAFDVVEADEVPKEVADKAKEAVDRKPAVHVKSSEPQKVALPGEDDIEDE